MTIVLFIAVLFFLILVHELGHFLTAKWSRMRVDEFAIGFPPRLFSIKKGETEYSINLLPIGGYVKIFGENGLEGDESRRSFGSRPKYQQAIVLLAGVAMNILAAWVIFASVAMLGTPTAITEDEWRANGQGDLLVTSVVPESPAFRAGIPLGAHVIGVSTNDDALSELTPSSFTDFIADNTGESITINYESSGMERSATIMSETGVIEGEPDREAVGLATALVAIQKASFFEALWIGTLRTFDSLVAITVGLVTFIGSALTLSADVSQVTGPIGIAGLVGQAAEFGFTSLFLFTAFISLNLAVINLLPIPALDGGRLLFVAAEAIIRRPIDPEWMARVNFIGFALLILLMVAVTYNDILRLW